MAIVALSFTLFFLDSSSDGFEERGDAGVGMEKEEFHRSYDDAGYLKSPKYELVFSVLPAAR